MNVLVKDLQLSSLLLVKEIKMQSTSNTNKPLLGQTPFFELGTQSSKKDWRFFYPRADDFGYVNIYCNGKLNLRLREWKSSKC